MKTITITCDSPNCPNTETLHGDSDIPKHWLCSACEDHLTELMIDELERRDNASRPATQGAMTHAYLRQR